MKNTLAQWYLLKSRLSNAQTVLWLVWQKVELGALLLFCLVLSPVFLFLVWKDRHWPTPDDDYDGGNW